MAGVLVYLFRRWPLPLLWVASLGLISVMIAWHSVDYFLPGVESAFLLEKGSIRHLPLWRAAFYLHVIGACTCLLVGIPLFFPRLTARRPGFHRILGRIYFVSVLGLGAPTGLIMSPYAKGGVWGVWGFAITGVLWWWVTWDGLAALAPRMSSRRDIPRHIRSMCRSYALALSAPIFRVFQWGFFGLGLDASQSYVVALWSSLFASLFIAECCHGFSYKSPPHLKAPGEPPRHYLEGVRP